MSLNFGWKNVKDADSVLFEYTDKKPKPDFSIRGSHWEDLGHGRWSRFHPWVDAVLMTSISIMPKPGWGITEKNVEAFVERLMIYQVAVGPLLQGMNDKGEIEEVYVTPEQVRSLVGLTVNVSTVNDSAFRATLMRGLKDKARDLAKKLSEPVVA